VSEATGRDKLTTAGVALGTPAYMAPEQATADPHVDHRADIYALGALAYELLSGRTPFLGHTPQAVLAAHVTEEAAPVRKYRDQVSMEVEAVVMKCLAKKPADRWQTADEMLPLLENLGTPSGGLTPTDTAPYQAATGAAPTVAGKRGLLIGAVAAVVVIAAGFGAWALRGGTGGSGSIDQIAVLPIMDLSGEDEVFVGAMHDALISAIALTNTVGVVSRTAVLSMEGGTTEDIARNLGVQAVMEGSVFRAGDEMRINVQLVEPSTLRHIWTGTYERNVSDVLAAQEEVVQTVATELGAALTSDNSETGS
jgi:serine/threonine-protein kinase